jgi:hypothetical protein
MQYFEGEPMTAISSYQALPLSVPAPQENLDIPAAAPGWGGLPRPLRLPWALKPVGSAHSGIDTLPDGRVRCWIRHEVLRGVTPRMLAWWFANLEGDVRVGTRRINRYRVWHPYDHVHASYARRLPGGGVGPGAVLRLTEVLGTNPDFLVDVTSLIEKLDEEGFIHNPVVHGLSGLARMEYTWRAVPGGTLYENCLVFGARGALGAALQPLLRRQFFPQAKGEAWLRHNIEEVGMFENFLPELYRQETGLEA